MTTPTQPPFRISSALLQLALLFGSVWLLQNVDLLALSTMELLLIILVLTAPIAFYRLEFPLLAHRSIFEQTTEEKSKTRTLLWRGSILQIATFFVSVGLAWVLLLLSDDLHEYYWYTLYAEAAVVFLLYLLLTRSLTGEVRPEHSPMLGRIVTQYLLVVLLTTGFVYLAYFYVGTPDLRSVPFEEVWRSAFTEKTEGANSDLVGITAGLTHAISQVSWKGMQLLDNQLEEGSVDLLIWIPYLLPGAIKAAIIIQLHLGLIGLVEWKDGKGFRFLGESTPARLFTAVFLVIIATSTWLDYKISTTELPSEITALPETLPIEDPCESIPEKVRDLTAQELINIERVRAAVEPTVSKDIANTTHRIYKAMSPFVDNYLDWYYSNKTQVLLQGMVVIDWGDKQFGDSKNRVADHIGKNIEHHILGPYTRGVKHMNDRVAKLANEALETEFIALQQRLKKQLVSLEEFGAEGCNIPVLQDIRAYMREIGVDGPGAAPVVGTGAVFISGTIAAKSAGKKLAGAVAGKTVSKTLTKMGLSLGSKAISMGTATAGGASAGAVCGPAAPACAIAGGIAAAIVFELTFNEADEALNRKKAKEDIMHSLLDMSVQTRTAYQEAYEEQINAAIQRTFRPDFVPGNN